MKAVITGDIIKSGNIDLQNRKLLLDELEYALDLWSKDYDMTYELFQGDSFQCLLYSPENALRLMLIIKTFIKSLNPNEAGHIKRPGAKIKTTFPIWLFDARIALGIGNTEPIQKSLGQSNGDAFILSGHLLDELKESKQTLDIITTDSFSEELHTECVLLDNIISRTTALQCEVVNLKLLGFNETKIATRLNIGQSAVNQRSTSGGWGAINTMVQRFENIYLNDPFKLRLF
jgi:hypothetical protein